MRKILLLLAAAVFLISACSKDKNSSAPEDPLAKAIIGKWALTGYTGPQMTLMGGNLHADPFGDTLIYTSDSQFLIITIQDTADRGSYTTGHGAAMNGFGRIQNYDSLLYHSSSLLADAVYRPMVYIRLEKDTLSVSTGYFKDSSIYRLYATYKRL